MGIAKLVTKYHNSANAGHSELVTKLKVNFYV